jgi:hypothetical protein
VKTVWDPITQSWDTLPMTRQAKVAERRREEARQKQIQQALTPQGRLEARRKYERERKARWRAEAGRH